MKIFIQILLIILFSSVQAEDQVSQSTVIGSPNPLIDHSSGSSKKTLSSKLIKNYLDLYQTDTSEAKKVLYAVILEEIFASDNQFKVEKEDRSLLNKAINLGSRAQGQVQKFIIQLSDKDIDEILNVNPDSIYMKIRRLTFLASLNPNPVKTEDELIKLYFGHLPDPCTQHEFDKLRERERESRVPFEILFPHIQIKNSLDDGFYVYKYLEKAAEQASKKDLPLAALLFQSRKEEQAINQNSYHKTVERFYEQLNKIGVSKELFESEKELTTEISPYCLTFGRNASSLFHSYIKTRQVEQDRLVQSEIDIKSKLQAVRNAERKAQDELNTFETGIYGGRIVPYFNEGKIEGLRIFAVKKDSVCESRGLKNGDIIIKINGIPLSNDQDKIYSISDVCDPQKSKTFALQEK